MNYISRRTDLVATIALAVIVFCAGYGWAQEDAMVTFQALKPNISLHEPVLIQFVVHNGSPQKIMFDLGFNRKSNFDITVIQPDGVRINVPSLNHEGVGRRGEVSLETDQTYTQVLLLDEWYDFNKIGIYEIQIKLRGSLQTESGTPVLTKLSTKLHIHIEPSNNQQLEQICRELTKTALESPAEKAMEAGEALSYIRDPIAVPFLAEVLKNSPFVKSLAIVGLTRIRDAQSVEVLINALKSRDPELQLLIQRGLHQIENETKDPNLKRRIADALER